MSTLLCIRSRREYAVKDLPSPSRVNTPNSRQVAFSVAVGRLGFLKLVRLDSFIREDTL